MTVLNALYAAFDHFNEYFYAKELLPRPVINIGSAGRMNALGWFLKSGWRDKKDQFHEINMSAEYLRRKPEETLETLLHEMAHLKNAVNNVRDCTSGQYHNKHFKRAAEEFGLIVKRTHNKGYAFTKLGEEAEKAIKEFKPKKETFKGLRRKRVGGYKEKKYISLIISAEYEEALTKAVGTSSMSQKEFVEDAVVQAIELALGVSKVQFNVPGLLTSVPLNRENEVS